MNQNLSSAARRVLPLAIFLAASSLHAATLHWDGTDGTGDADGGTGTWNLTSLNWDSAVTAGANSIWSSSTPDIATFGGTAGTVTLGSTIIAGGLTFTHGSGTYTIAGGSSSNVLSIGAGAITTTAGGTTSITAPLFQSGSVTITNAGNLSISSIILGGATTLNPTTTNLTIGSVTVPGQTLTLGGAGGGEITGIISLNIGGLTKSGGGAWTVSNSKNLYTGQTSVNQGTLKLGVSNALGFGTGTLSIGNSATAFLDLNSYNATVGQISAASLNVGTITNNASSSTSTLTFGSGVTAATTANYAGRIQDNGTGKVALTKVGAGAQTLNGSITNAFTGGINVNGGVLTLDFSNMTTPTNLVGSTNTLGLAGGSLRITGKAATTSNQTLGNVTINAGGAQILGMNNSGTIGINLTLGNLDTSAAGGSLQIGSASASGTTGLTITTTTDKDATGIYGGRVVFFNGTAGTGYDWATSSGGPTYTLVAYGGYAAMATSGTDAENSRITTGASLVGSLTTNSLKVAAPGASQSLALGSNLLTLTSGGLLVTGANAFSVTGTAGGTRLTAGDGGGSAADLVVSHFNSGGSNNLTISAVIGDNTAGSGNTVNLVKAGGNHLTLSGNNTYTGRTYLNINSGTTTISGSSTTSGTTMASGSTLNLTNASGLGSGDLTMNGGTFNNSTGSPLTLDNALNISGDVIFNSSNLQNITQQTGAVTLTGKNIITVSNNTLTLNGSIGGTGGFFKQGSGTLTLGGASNTYSGPTLINAGTLNINTAIDSDQILILGGTVNLGASNVLPSSATVAVDGTGATLNLAGFNQTIGTLTMGSNSGSGKGLVGGVGSTLTLTGGIITSNHNGGDGGNITVSTLDLNNATQNFFLGGSGGGTDDLSISSVVQNGGINIVGTAAATAVTLSNANTYSGATSINSAILRLAHLGALQNSPLETSGTGTVTLAAGVGNYTLGGLTGGKNLATVIAGTPTNLTTLTLNPGTGATYSYSGVIGDLSTGMAVTKTGAGTQALSGVNTYTGVTNVDQGTLLVGVAGVGSTHASSAVTVNTGGTLGGNGTIGGATSIKDGGIHAAAATLGTAADVQKFTGNLTYEDASIFAWEIDRTQTQTRGTGYDSVNVTGTLAGLDGGDVNSTTDAKFRIVIGDSDFTNAFWASNNHSWADIFTDADGTTAKSSWASIFGGGFEYYKSDGSAISAPTTGSFSLTGNTLSWAYTPIPEPSAALGGLLLTAGLLRRRRLA